MIEILKTCGEVLIDYSLKDLNTYKIESKTKYLVKPYNKNLLIKLLKYLNTNNIKYFILGGGSNIILSDNTFDGVIIKLDNFNKVKILKNSVFVEAGVMLNKFSFDMCNNGLCGLEWATGIPGTVGGSIVGNAGAYNNSISDFINEVYFLDENLNFKTLKKAEFKSSYRYTIFKENKKNIILGAKLNLKHGNKNESLELIKERLQRRLSSQPLEYPSAGSVFRNPSKEIFAGKLIEDLGLKGYNVNDAKISEKHANFIINVGNATGKDIIDLINLIKEKVKITNDIDLLLEQEIINW